MKKIVIVFIILASTIFYFSYDRFTNTLSSNIPYAIYSKENKNSLMVMMRGPDEFMNDQDIKRFIEYIDEKDLNVYTFDRYPPQNEYYVRSKDPSFLKYINTVNGPPKELKQFETYSMNTIDNEYKMYGNLDMKYRVHTLEDFSFRKTSIFCITTNDNVKMQDIEKDILNDLEKFDFYLDSYDYFNPISSFVQNFIIISVAIVLSIFILYNDSKSEAMINALYLEGYTQLKIFFKFFFKKLKGLVVVPITYVALFVIFIKLPVFKTVLFWEVVFGYSLIGFGVFFIITSLIFFYIKERNRILKNKKLFLLGGYNLPILITQFVVLAAAIVLVIDCVSSLNKIKHIKSLVEYKMTENYYRVSSSYYFNQSSDDEQFQKYGKIELEAINELILENRGFIFIYIDNHGLDLHNNIWIPAEYYLYYVDENYVKTFIDPNYDKDSSSYIYIPQSYRDNSTVGSLDNFVELDKRAPAFTGPVLSEQLEEIPSIYVSLDYEEYRKSPGVIPYADSIAVVIYSESDEVETTNVVKEKYAKYGQEFKGNAYSVHEFYTDNVLGLKMLIIKAGQILIMPAISLIVMFIFFFRDFKQRLTINFGNQTLKRNTVISLLIVITLVIILGVVLNRFLFPEIVISYYDHF